MPRKNRKSPAESLLDKAGKATTFALESGVAALGTAVENVRVAASKLELAAQTTKRQELQLKSFSESQDERDAAFDSVAEAAVTIARKLARDVQPEALNRSVYEAWDRQAFGETLAQTLRTIPDAGALANVVDEACTEWKDRTYGQHAAVAALEAARSAEKAAQFRLEVAVKHLELAMLELAPAVLKELHRKPLKRRKNKEAEKKEESSPSPVVAPAAAVPVQANPGGVQVDGAQSAMLGAPGFHSMEGRPTSSAPLQSALRQARDGDVTPSCASANAH